LISNKVADPDHLGVFENSFHLTNYENFLKKEPDAKDKAEDGKEKDKDHDPRKERVRKKVTKYTISTEDT